MTTLPGSPPDMLRSALDRAEQMSDEDLAAYVARNQPPASGAPKTQQTVRAMQLGAAVPPGCDGEFWLLKAQQDLDIRAARSELALRQATHAVINTLLTGRRHRGQARVIAVRILTAAGHPAVTDPVVSAVPLADPADGKSAG